MRERERERERGVNFIYVSDKKISQCWKTFSEKVHYLVIDLLLTISCDLFFLSRLIQYSSSSFLGFGVNYIMQIGNIKNNVRP